MLILLKQNKGFFSFNPVGVNNNTKDGMIPDETWKIGHTACLAIHSGKACSIDFSVSVFIGP